MSTLNVEVQPQLNEWLEAKAKEQGWTKAKLVREILLAYYHIKTDKPLPPARKVAREGKAMERWI